MEDNEVLYADPWLKNVEETTKLPADARFVCSYDLDIIVDELEVVLFLRRTATKDELWIANVGFAGDPVSFSDPALYINELAGREISHVGCVFAIQRKDDEFTACVKLLELFFRTVHFFEWPSGFISQGIVDKNTFDGITRKIKKELEENEQKAREKETNIIKVARNLGLHPEPTGDSPSSWRARCPGMNHPLFMDTKENIFFCGWCKRKGTAEDLILLVEERNKSRK